MTRHVLSEEEMYNNLYYESANWSVVQPSAFGGSYDRKMFGWRIKAIIIVVMLCNM